MATAPTTVTVPVTSAWSSKITWTQVISFAATVLTVFGIDLDAQTQVYIVTAINGVAGAVT